jgi:hypothetical protein
MAVLAARLRRGSANYMPLAIINVVIHVAYHDLILPLSASSFRYLQADPGTVSHF